MHRLETVLTELAGQMPPTTLWWQYQFYLLGVNSARHTASAAFTALVLIPTILLTWI